MIGSWKDWDLTELGVEQATRIGNRLSKNISSKEYTLYSSDLLRAKHTAEIIAEHIDIKPIFIDALREFNLGEAMGKSKEWARNNSICSVWDNTIDWAKSIDDKPFKNAESKRDVWNRLLPFYTHIMKNENENIMIVSHGGTLSVFFALWLNLEIEFLNKCNFSGQSGGVSFLYKDNNGHHIIKKLNDMSYQCR